MVYGLCVLVLWKYVIWGKSKKLVNNIQTKQICFKILRINVWTNEGNKKMFYLMIHSTHLQLYGIGHIRTTKIAREEFCCHHMAYSFQLAAWVILYAPSHIQDSINHGLCYTSHGTLARNEQMSELINKWMNL